MIFLIQFIRELKSGAMYLLMGLVVGIPIFASLLGISWVAGFLIDKLFNIEQLQPSNYIVYGTYTLMSVVFVSLLLLTILIWILMAYKSVMDKNKKNG